VQCSADPTVLPFPNTYLSSTSLHDNHICEDAHLADSSARDSRADSTMRIFTRDRLRGRTGQLLSICGLLSIAMLPAATIADKTAADYFVHSLPGAPEPLLKMHAGYVPIVFDTKMGLC